MNINTATKPTGQFRPMSRIFSGNVNLTTSPRPSVLELMQTECCYASGAAAKAAHDAEMERLKADVAGIKSLLKMK